MNWSKVWVLAGLSLMASGCGKKETVVAAKSLTPVRAFSVKASGAVPEMRYAGSLEATALVTLAFRAPGAIEAIHQVRGVDGRARALETGDCVAAGTVLARIRTTEFQARTDAARAQVSDATAARAASMAQVEEAQAGLAHAELDWGRAQKLLAGSAMTRAEGDAVKARLDAARSRVEAARAQVRVVDAKIESAAASAAESKVGLGDTVVVAPFAGCVVSRQAERGAFAQPGASAFVLADLNRVKVVFHIPDTELARLKPGARVEATVEALGNRELAAVVQSIAPAADAVTRNFRVEAIAANPGRELRAGLIASVRLPGGVLVSELTVPVSAIVRGAGDSAFTVFTLEGNTLRRQSVTLGAARGNEVVVTAGLREGQKVIREGVAGLVEGETVQVVE